MSKHIHILELMLNRFKLIVNGSFEFEYSILYEVSLL